MKTELRDLTKEQADALVDTWECPFRTQGELDDALKDCLDRWNLNDWHVSIWFCTKAEMMVPCNSEIMHADIRRNTNRKCAVIRVQRPLRKGLGKWSSAEDYCETVLSELLHKMSRIENDPWPAWSVYGIGPDRPEQGVDMNLYVTASEA